MSANRSANLVYKDGVWRQILTGPVSGPPRAGLFIDRDGVIVEEVNYLSRIEDVVMIPGACEAIARANRRGMPVVIVTNQGGIARGYYSWEEFRLLQDHVTDLLARGGATIDAVYACAHHAEGIGVYAHPDHPARKPRPGMLLCAATELNLNLRHSWIVGDKMSDLEAGRAAGLAGCLHVLTGHGPAHRNAAPALETPEFRVLLANSIRDSEAIAAVTTYGGN